MALGNMQCGGGTCAVFLWLSGFLCRRIQHCCASWKTTGRRRRGYVRNSSLEHLTAAWFHKTGRMGRPCVGVQGQRGAQRSRRAPCPTRSQGATSRACLVRGTAAEVHPALALARFRAYPGAAQRWRRGSTEQCSRRKPKRQSGRASTPSLTHCCLQTRQARSAGRRIHAGRTCRLHGPSLRMTPLRRPSSPSSAVQPRTV